MRVAVESDSQAPTSDATVNTVEPAGRLVIKSTTFN